MAGNLTEIDKELDRPAADREAIARWEDEGGRTLAREERLYAEPGEPPDSNRDEAPARLVELPYGGLREACFERVNSTSAAH
jgi:hypothetical protein